MVSSTARRLLARIALVLACGLMVALPLSHYLCVRYALHVGYIAGTLYGFGLLAAAVVAAAFLLRAVPRRDKGEGVPGDGGGGAGLSARREQRLHPDADGKDGGGRRGAGI